LYQVADLRFLFTAMLVTLLKGGSSFDEVVEARFSEVSWVVGLEVVLLDSRGHSLWVGAK